MTIMDGDIKLLKSQVMGDVPEGGGRATGTAILDGSSNSIFTDISELDRTYGRVNLMKTFVSVATPDTDGYFGANVIISDPPDDAKVTCVLFTTNDGFDQRASAAGRVESYLAQGSLNAALLFGNHIAGQMVVTIIQRESVSLPIYGDTLVLRKNEGLPNQYDQYVRVTDVSSVVRLFSDESTVQLGEFKRVVVSLGISDALQQDFTGFDAVRHDSVFTFTGKSKLYNTIIADAARYYGAVPLAVAGNIGDVVAKGVGIFMQLVPSTRVEVPVLDARMSQQKFALIKSGVPYTDVVTMGFHNAASLYIGSKVLPGSLTLLRSGITLTDKAGVLYKDSEQVGTIDYTNGILALAINVFGTSSDSHTITYTPADDPKASSSTLMVKVIIANQRLSWALTLASLPAVGSLQVSYRNLDRWYALSDNGAGEIRGGDSSFGVGTINYTTGSVSLTLGALPDVDSSILFEWVDTFGAKTINSSPEVTITKFAKVALLGISLKPSTVSLSWNDGAAKTANDTAVVGELGGDATGGIFYADGKILFRPNVLPPKNTVVTVSTTLTTKVDTTVTGWADGGSTWNYTFAAPITPRTFAIQVELSYPSGPSYTAMFGVSSFHRPFPAYDNGSGSIVTVAADNSITTLGTINYSTGAVTLVKSVTSVVSRAAFRSDDVLNPAGSVPSTNTRFTYIGQSNDTVSLTVNPALTTTATHGGTTSTGTTSTFTVNELLLETSVAPSGFTLGSNRHSMQLLNTLVRNPSPSTGLGVVCGSMGTSGGLSGLVLTDWVTGTTGLPTNVQGVNSIGETNPTTSIAFRTAISPLFNGAFSLQGTRTDGTTFNVSPDVAGLVNNTGAGVFGTVDYKTGVANVQFGYPISASYSADLGVVNVTHLGISGVTHIKLYGVLSNSLKYNAVGYSYIPLDSGILGLNPVRLPSDGKVPIFRKGGVVVIHNEQTIAAQTVINAQTVNVGRTRLSQIRVLGASNASITGGFTTDLDAGTITFTNVTGYSQPVRIVHRIEDMALVTDAQINGQLTLNRQLTHAFPTAGSYISSALIIGDMRSRVPVFFDQYTWTVGSWLDTVFGTAATGTYNDVLAPVVVTNAGAITERWIIQFTNTTAFNIIGENSGVIGTGNTATLCAPNNPSTGSPYFSIAAVGWGSGWVAGNILRFNTIGALFPVWVMRTIQQGPATATDDSFTILIRGDIDRP